MIRPPAPAPAGAARPPARTVLARGAVLFAAWVLLIRSGAPLDLAFGLFTAAFATWASLRLVPPGAGFLRFGALLAFVPRFLWQSVVAGIDVARRALAPRLPLRTGFVAYPVGLPRGLARNTFATITSLLPGTVPCADEDAALDYHCLDVGEPVVEQLAAEERALARALVPERRDA